MINVAFLLLSIYYVLLIKREIETQKAMKKGKENERKDNDNKCAKV